ncbi:MAG: hypothetical protein A2W33_08375 [Chloroflexi bacterium RBG_16_52_11]|nr:MAG: hypothetical protein A2W33_08375 [Chloroflexi bacterium RBG_16_52_11]
MTTIASIDNSHFRFYTYPNPNTPIVFWQPITLGQLRSWPKLIIPCESLPFMRSHVSNPRILLLGLLFLLCVAFRLWVSQTTWMHYDENYYLNIAQNYIARGELTPYMWRLGDTNIIAGSGSGYGVLLLAIWLKLVNGSLYLGRLFMVMAGLLAAGLMYQIGSRWWGSNSAGIVALAFALASTSPFYTLTLRMDAIGVLAYCVVLLLFTSAIRPNASPWLSFVVGVLAVVTLEIHILGVVYLLALGVTYQVYLIRDTLHTRRLSIKHPAVLFAAGAGLASFVYFLIHILPDPTAYFIISQKCVECDKGILSTEIERLILLMILRPIELLLLFVVLTTSLRRRSQQDKRYLLLVAGWIAVQAVVGTPPYVHYASHFWPILALGVGGLVTKESKFPTKQTAPQESRRIITALLIALVILISNLAMFLASKPPYLLAYQLKETPAVRYIQENIPRDSVIMGNVLSYYGLRDYPNYLSYRDGDKFGVLLRGETMTAFWEREQPIVVLVDEKDVLKDPELRDYLRLGKFIQIQSDLWVAEHIRGLQP